MDPRIDPATSHTHAGTASVRHSRDYYVLRTLGGVLFAAFLVLCALSMNHTDNVVMRNVAFLAGGAGVGLGVIAQVIDGRPRGDEPR